MSTPAVCLALSQHFGHSNWTLIGEDRVRLDGESQSVLIADLAIEGLIAQCEYTLATHDNDIKRKQAYASEADPLFFKWQAGESTEALWRAKREEIRARYPDPVQPDFSEG